MEFFLCLALSACSLALGTDVPTPFYDDLLQSKKATSRNNDFEYPFLISQTAQVKNLSREEAAKKLEAIMQGGALKIPGHVSVVRALVSSPEFTSLVIPAEVTTGTQREAIQSCSVDKCLMKLGNQKEKGQIQRSADKVA